MVDFIPVDHDPFADDAAPVAAGRDPQGFWSRFGAGTMNLLNKDMLPQPAIVPSLIKGVGEGLYDTMQTAVTPQLPVPAGSMTDDTGLTRQGSADPAEWQAFVADQQKRQDLAPSIALGMIGGGAPGAERGALGALGGRLSPLDNAEAYRAAAINRANRGLPTGHAAEGWTAKAAPVPTKGSTERTIAEMKAGWQNDKGQALADFQYAANPNLSAADRAYMESPGFVLGSGATDERLGAANLATQAEHAAAQQPGIRAYHGSPHDFDQFDISKIGTGEGAQAYGHGLYFAENQKTAQAYRDSLAAPMYQTRSGQPITQGSAFTQLMDRARDIAPDLHPDLRRGAVNQILTGIDELGSAKKWMKEYAAPPGYENLYSAVASKADALGLTPHKGRMYEVNIAAHPDQFLDWDKPLSEQRPEVQKKLEDVARYQQVPKKNNVGAETTGSQMVDYLERRFGNKGTATDELHQAGIPGIKYLDQGSRYNPAALPNNPIANEARQFLDAAKGDSAAALKQFNDSTPVSRWGQTERDEVQRVIKAAGQKMTSNYVVFDPKLIDIVKKYGIAGMAAFPAGAHMLEQVDHDPFAPGKASGGRVVHDKLPHSAVGYVAHSHLKGKHCSVCTMFRDGPSCDLVRTPIAGGGWCRRFAAKAAATNNAVVSS